ncbi:nucleotidyl transferase AbiEii/AbiGii toxin family protein [Lentilitoribacter sp. EG35]|uniref:nucleotidyl transferase AbiEii/AbiGii toxin family protein n=1 Tax=Lentilitoribacter sp. EG35 TaxID=3234192 RepID=UPI0034607A8C
MSALDYQTVISATAAERSDLFLMTAQRLGAPLINIEKDFWVCWTLNCLYHRVPDNGPRLLFKGGTSLSKAYGLINRFSEDIDVTVFRDDLGHTQTPEELGALSNRKRKAALDAIKNDCRAYITGPLLEAVSNLILEDTNGKGRIEIDSSDETGQTLLVWYPRVDDSETGYVQAAVKIESGAKSALDPNAPRTIAPYISDDVSNLDLMIPDVTTIDAERTFWDKVVILHGLYNWFESRGVLKQDGQRVSRHYYDLHCMFASDIGQRAIADDALGRDCVAHAKTFFNRPAFDLNSAATGTFTLVPPEPMLERLRADYRNTEAMIFGDAPKIEDILGSIQNIENALNATGEGRAQ